MYKTLLKMTPMDIRTQNRFDNNHAQNFGIYQNVEYTQIYPHC